MNDQMQTIHISGITCDACIKLITKKLSRVVGVSEVVSVTQDGKATVKASDTLAIHIYEDAFMGTPYTVVRVN